MKFFIPCFLLMFGCFQVSAQNDSLINVLEKTLEEKIDDLGAEHPDVAVYCDSLGLMYMTAANYAQADSLFKLALDIKLKNKEAKHPDVARSYHYIGIIYYYIGDYEKAIDFFDKALKIRLEVLGGKHPDVAKCYNNLGAIYAETGDYEKAINLYDKSLNIALKILGEKHPAVATTYCNIATIYEKAGDYEKAMTFYTKALNIRLEVFGEQHVDVAMSYTNVGICYGEKGDYEKAISFFNKALSIKLKVLDEKHPLLISSYNNLGMLYGKIGDYEKAIGCYEKALNIITETHGENHPNSAITYQFMGEAYYYVGNYKKAIMLYEKALSIQRETFGEKHALVADSYNGLGFVYIETGNYEQATNCFGKALNIQGEVVANKQTKGTALSYNGLGIIDELTGDYEKAINFHNKALNIRLELFDKKHPDVIDSYHELALNYEKNSQHKTADSLWQIAIPQITNRLKSTYLFLENNRSIKYSNKLSPTIDDFYSFTAIHGTESTTQLATNFLINTKSLALEYAVSTNQLIKNINDSTLIAQYEQLKNLNQQIADTEKLTNEERKAKGIDLSEIQDQQDQLAFQVFQHPQLKSKLNIKDIEWQDIQNHLATDEVTIDFLKIYEQKDSLWAYYAILIHKNYPSPQLVRIADEKTLAKLLKTGKNERPYYLNDRRSTKSLYKIFWQPIVQYLQNIKTIHISPSGILHRVPFESLYDENNEYLSTKYDFHYHTAIRDLLKEKPQQTTYKDMVLMGHILYDLDEKDQYESAEQALAFRGNTRDSIRPLPETLREVVQIKRAAKKAKLKTKLLTIDAASEDAVQRFVKENAPSIFHFATHGVFLPPLEKTSLGTPGSRDRLRAADNPLQRSALMLYGANETWTKGSSILSSGEDGILTALEVSTLDLQNTGLVVLSACSTGLGNVHNTEGVFGLQRAFKLAGVDYVVASLWDVDDEATKDLMVAFYKNLLQKKQQPATALRHAKDQLRKADYQPQDWAGFILIE